MHPRNVVFISFVIGILTLWIYPAFGDPKCENKDVIDTMSSLAMELLAEAVLDETSLAVIPKDFTDVKVSNIKSSGWKEEKLHCRAELKFNYQGNPSLMNARTKINQPCYEYKITDIGKVNRLLREIVRVRNQEWDKLDRETQNEIYSHQTGSVDDTKLPEVVSLRKREEAFRQWYFNGHYVDQEHSMFSKLMELSTMTTVYLTTPNINMLGQKDLRPILYPREPNIPKPLRDDYATFDEYDEAYEVYEEQIKAREKTISEIQSLLSETFPLYTQNMATTEIVYTVEDHHDGGFWVYTELSLEDIDWNNPSETEQDSENN